MVIREYDLKNITGGLNISGSLISSFVRGIDIIMDVGRSLGTALRRIKDKNLCSF